MRATEFKTGHLYGNIVQTHKGTDFGLYDWIMAGKNSRETIGIRMPKHSLKFPGEAYNPEKLELEYEEIGISVLTPEEVEIYKKACGTSTCICDISMLMVSGCQCGWIQKERSLAKHG